MERRTVRRSVTFKDNSTVGYRIKTEPLSPKHEHYEHSPHFENEDMEMEADNDFFSFASLTDAACPIRIRVKQEDIEVAIHCPDVGDDSVTAGSSIGAWATACRNVADAATAFADLEVSRAEAKALAASLAVSKAEELAAVAKIAEEEAAQACLEAKAAKRSAISAAKYALSTTEAAERAEAVAAATVHEKRRR